MVKAAIICPNDTVRTQLQESLSDLADFSIIRAYGSYPTALELRHFIRAQEPDVLFVGLENLAKALLIVNDAVSDFPGLPIVAVNDKFDQDSLLRMMRAGARDCIFPPFNWKNLSEMLNLVDRLAQKKDPVAAPGGRGDFYCFLPAKPGVGCSTVAVNTTFSLARIWRGKLLLSDCDFSSGILRFLLKVTNQNSMRDAAENSGILDENLWPKLVTAFDNLDVIHAGALDPSFRVESAQILQVAELWRRLYDVVSIDLSGALERFSMDLMAEAKLIFLVSTPELASLHMAREKVRILGDADLGTRVRLVLNRSTKYMPIPLDQIPKLVGIPIHRSFTNDYRSVNNAITRGTPLRPDCELGEQFTELAASLSRRHEEVEKTGRKRLIELFGAGRVTRANANA